MTAAVPILLVSTATGCYGTARTPRALTQAGFEVTLLTPRNSLAESSRFVARVAYLPDQATRLDWVHAVAATVRAVSPALVIPCDDVSFRLLAMLVVAPPPQLQPGLQAELGTLVRASLGDPAHYATSVDRSLLPGAAVRAGVRVPAHVVVATPDDATAFAAQHGYPVVVKRAYPMTGDGLRIAADRTAVIEAVSALTTPARDDLAADSARPLLIQKHVDGHRCCQAAAAWQGRMLAGYAGHRLRPLWGGTTPDSVVGFRNAPELRGFSERLLRAFGVTGLVAIEYVIEEASGRAYLLEINRQISPATHYGALMNVDLCAALHAAMHDVPSPTRGALDAGEERVFVEFPAEWLRDPESRWLRQYPVDLPWDDPELLEAMLVMKRQD